MADTSEVRIDPRWAWEPYRPNDKAPWDLKRAGHLYRRAAFGATFTELQAALKKGPQKAIDDLLAGGPGQDAFDKQTEALVESIVRANNGQQLRDWWLYRMLYTPHPLREKLTLFWHNHFATSNRDVQNAGYMYRQYNLLRKHALGSFAQLLQEMSLDPAMSGMNSWTRATSALSASQSPGASEAKAVTAAFDLIAKSVSASAK